MTTITLPALTTSSTVYTSKDFTERARKMVRLITAANRRAASTIPLLQICPRHTAWSLSDPRDTDEAWNVRRTVATFRDEMRAAHEGLLCPCAEAGRPDLALRVSILWLDLWRAAARYTSHPEIHSNRIVVRTATLFDDYLVWITTGSLDHLLRVLP